MSNEAPGGSPVDENVTVWPWSGSVALTMNCIENPGNPDVVAGTFTVGGLLTVTSTVKLVERCREPLAAYTVRV